MAGLQFQVRGGNGTANALRMQILGASAVRQLATQEGHHPRCTRSEKVHRQAWGRRFAPTRRDHSDCLDGNIIERWRIALRARASLVQNVGLGFVVKEPAGRGMGKDKFRANCPAPECGKEFEFEASETRVFEVPLPLFERRHFYGSELH